MFQEIYNGYVSEIILHVHKGGVDLPDSKKIIKKYFQKARPKSKNQQKWKSMDDFQKAWTIFQKARKNHWKSIKISAF